MLSETLRNQLNTAPPSAEIALILRWKPSPCRPDFAGIANRVERWRAMEAYYNRTKAPVLDAIAATPGVEVDALEGTEQAIVIGSAKTLMTLIQNEPLLSRDDIDVLPNDPHYARPAL